MVNVDFEKFCVRLILLLLGALLAMFGSDVIHLKVSRDVLFEFHLKFWNTTSIGIPVRSLL